MSEQWTTDDLALATFLSLNKHAIEEMEWRPPGDCFFVFQRNPDLMIHVINYTGNDARVDPKEFITEYGRVKKAMLEDRPKEMDPRRRRVRA